MEHIVDINLCIDPHFKIPNIKMFSQNQPKYNYNKMCMTEIVNADLAIATQGIDTYYLGCNEVLSIVSNALKSMHLEDTIHLYALNYKNFILTANDDLSKREFVKIIRFFYEQFEHTTADSTPLSGVSRFALVLQPDRMVERALNTFFFNRDKQDNFLISKDEFQNHDHINTHSNVVELLSKAVNEKQIVPFFQGIHNNKTNKIDKYESLMRIVDENGKIYSPNYFLSVAKEYKFYNKISKMMIEEVLLTFYNRSEEFSINISLYDIQTADFRKWFLEELKVFPDPERIIIEFVETENFVEDHTYFSFINDVREVGCKIAVDDFGSGYASHARLISLKPDYIKIDGSIIKDITHKEENLIIFQSICFLAELIGASVVAEFVENAEIQSLLVKQNTAYSQGYYFAKPLPIDNI